jgi:hypothetical protein
MTTKTDIKKLLSKGLTGKEAGKLALQDFWEEDHFREGFLSERDLSAIKASLKTPQDIRDYNSYMETYKLLDYTLKDLHIISLELQRRLSAVSRLAMMYLFDATSVFELTKRPLIMTEKQYKEYKKEARERILNELHSLEDIIDRHAFELDPKEIDWNKLGLDPVKYQDCPDDSIFTEWIKEEAPGLWKLIISKILELVKEGKLKAVYITGKDREKLDLLWNKIDDLRAEISKLPREEKIEMLYHSSAHKELDIKIKKLDQQEEDLLQSIYKKGINKNDQTELIKALEKLLEGSLTKEEEEDLLLYTFSSGRDLYNSGLPEWIEWIDEYPGYTKDIDDRGIAIIVDPDPDKLDDKGHYKSIYKSYNELLTQERDFDLIGTFTGATKQAKEEIKVILAFQAILQILSVAIGIDFTEDIKVWIKDVESEIGEYNRLKLRVESEELIPEEIKETLPYLDINKFKPSAKTTKYLKERLSMSLGDNWWNDVRQAFREDLEAMEAEDDQ